MKEELLGEAREGREWGQGQGKKNRKACTGTQASKGTNKSPTSVPIVEEKPNLEPGVSPATRQWDQVFLFNICHQLEMSGARRVGVGQKPPTCVSRGGAKALGNLAKPPAVDNRTP